MTEIDEETQAELLKKAEIWDEENFVLSKTSFLKFLQIVALY